MPFTWGRKVKDSACQEAAVVPERMGGVLQDPRDMAKSLTA
jgi:hypothetical protein